MSRQIGLVARLQIGLDVVVDESGHPVEAGVNGNGDRAVFANGEAEILSPVLVIVGPADRNDLDTALSSCSRKYRTSAFPGEFSLTICGYLCLIDDGLS
jgi:hypothetical protein